METLLVQPSSVDEMIQLKEFLSKNNIKSRVLSEEEKEDYALGILMQETDYNNVTDTNSFIKQLQQK